VADGVTVATAMFAAVSMETTWLPEKRLILIWTPPEDKADCWPTTMNMIVLTSSVMESTVAMTELNEATSPEKVSL